MGAATAFLLLIIVIVAIGAGVAFYALRAGLWNKETSPKGDTAESGAGEGRFERRPEHTEVEEPGNQTYVGTGEPTDRSA
jgi:hypothetical protein